MQKASRDMAKLRLGICAHEKHWTYFDPMRERDCPKFAQAEAGIVVRQVR